MPDIDLSTIAICPICGNGFPANRQTHQKYCRSECAEESNRRRMRQSYTPAKRIDYAAMDELILAGEEYPAIAAKIGCCTQTVSARARKIGIRKKEQNGKYDEESQDAPLIPPLNRFKIACERKARHLGMTLTAFKETWLVGAVGRQWMNDMRFLGATV